MTQTKTYLLTAFILGALVVAGVWYWSAHFSGVVIDSKDTSDNIFQIASSTGDNYFTVTADGKVGIRNQAPTTELDVYGTLRVYDHEPRECTPLIEGAIQYRGDNKHFWGCDGTAWRRLDGAP